MLINKIEFFDYFTKNLVSLNNSDNLSSKQNNKYLFNTNKEKA